MFTKRIEDQINQTREQRFGGIRDCAKSVRYAAELKRNPSTTHFSMRYRDWNNACIPITSNGPSIDAVLLQDCAHRWNLIKNEYEKVFPFQILRELRDA